MPNVIILSIRFMFYISVISPDYGRNIAYIRNKRILEHLCCCIGLIIIENINVISNTYYFLYIWFYVNTSY